MTIHLLIVCGFGIAMTELSSCDQEVLAQKAENVYYLATTWWAVSVPTS